MVACQPGSRRWGLDVGRWGLAAGACRGLDALLLFLVVRFVKRRGPITRVGLVALGVLWAGLTLAFEFGMGCSRGLPLEAMLADYNLLEGKLWPLVPLTLLTGPLLAGSLRPARPSGDRSNR